MTIWKSKPINENTIEVPIDEFKIIMCQLWKSRMTEPQVGKIFEKYKNRINPF